MGCCNCCCPSGESCCQSQGPNGICCASGRCCGTPESPVCCEEGTVCCDGVCCPEGQCCNEGECGPCECESDEDCPEGQCCNEGECGPCQTCESGADCQEGEQCCNYLEWVDDSSEGIISKPGVCIDIGRPCCICPAYHDTLELRVDLANLWQDEYTLNLVSGNSCTPRWEYESDDLQFDDLGQGQLCKGELISVAGGPAPLLFAQKWIEDGSRLSFQVGGGNAPGLLSFLTKPDVPGLPIEFRWCKEHSFTDNWEAVLEQFPFWRNGLQQFFPAGDVCTNPLGGGEQFFRAGGFWYLSSP